MLALSNRTPYAAERTFVRDMTGADHWVVAVKATFAVESNGTLKLADEQLPPLLAPEYFGEPGLSSIRYETDLTLMKPGTDVLVNATAYAPRGQAVDQLPVRLRAHRIDKTLQVYGPRVMYSGPLGITTTGARPFTRMPIRYEDAYGGTDTTSPEKSQHRADMRNPVGRGFATRAAHLEQKPAPSVVYINTDPSKPGPAGFGVIASYWTPRRELGGTYDEKWAKDQRPLLPLDWSEQSLMCAPSDQRSEYLRGDEPVELVHLTPEGVFRFNAPKVFLAFRTFFGSKVEEHRSKLVSLIIEPDDRHVMAVWQTTLRVSLRQMDYLDKTVIEEKRYLS